MTLLKSLWYAPEVVSRVSTSLQIFGAFIAVMVLVYGLRSSHLDRKKSAADAERLTNDVSRAQKVAAAAEARLKPRILSKMDAFLLSEDFRKHAGSRVSILFISSSAECAAFGNQLEIALKAAGLSVEALAYVSGDAWFDVEIVSNRSEASGIIANDLYNALRKHRIAVRISTGGIQLDSIIVKIGEKTE